MPTTPMSLLISAQDRSAVSAYQTGRAASMGEATLSTTELSAGDIAMTPDGRTAYVLIPESTSIVVLDLSAGPAPRVIKKLRLQPSVDVGAVHLTITPDGRTLLVLNRYSKNVRLIDVASDQLGPLIPVGTYPTAISVSPDSRTVYVTNQDDATVSVFTLPGGERPTTIKVGANPVAVAFCPVDKGGTSLAYVVNDGSTKITQIRNGVVDKDSISIAQGGGVWLSVAFNPTGTRAYVGSKITRAIIPVDVANNVALTAIPVGDWPLDIKVAPDGLSAYVATFNGTVPIDLVKGVAGTLFGGPAAGLAFFATPPVRYPDGLLYAVNGVENTVTVLDLATRKGVWTFPVGSHPSEVVVSPDATIALIPASSDAGSVTQLAVGGHSVGHISADDGASAVAFSPNSRTALVTSKVASTLTSVVFSDPTRPGVVATKAPLRLDSSPQGIAIAPDGTSAYITHSAGSVTVISLDPTTGAVSPLTWIYNVGPGAFGVAFDPRRPYAYVAAHTHGLTRIDTTKKVVNTLLTGLPGARAVAVTRDGARAYVGGGSRLFVVDLDSFTVVGSPIGVGDNVRDIAIFPDGQTVFVARDGGLNAVDPVTSVVEAMPLTGDITAIAVTRRP